MSEHRTQERHRAVMTMDDGLISESSHIRIILEDKVFCEWLSLVTRSNALKLFIKNKVDDVAHFRCAEE